MKAADLRSKSVDELNEELVALRREQFNLRMQISRALRQFLLSFRVQRVKTNE